MGECWKREGKVTRRKQQWPTAAVTTLTITYFALTRTTGDKAAATTATAAAAAAAAATAATAATSTAAAATAKRWSRGRARWQCGRRRWRQDVEQRDIQPRGWWSRTQLLGPSVAIFSSGIPQASWWRCAHRRDSEAGHRRAVRARPQPQAPDGGDLEQRDLATAAAGWPGADAGGDGSPGVRPSRRPASEQWQWRERTGLLCGAPEGGTLPGGSLLWGPCLSSTAPV